MSFSLRTAFYAAVLHLGTAALLLPDHFLSEKQGLMTYGRRIVKPIRGDHYRARLICSVLYPQSGSPSIQRLEGNLEQAILPYRQFCRLCRYGACSSP